MERPGTETQKTVKCGCPVLRFVYNNNSVFELVCKTILLTLVIPYGSLLLLGLIDSWFHIAQLVWVPAAILGYVAALFILGVTLSVISIVRYSKKIKTVSR